MLDCSAFFSCVFRKKEGNRLNSYKTLEKAASDEFVVKKSRFIGYAAPVQTNEQAVEFINLIKAKHRDARHNVYAYCLREGQIRRYSDDGEPQGTAGMPVLDVLLKEELTDCVLVATRYFGGTLLGANGLVRAYTHTAKIGIESAGIITVALCRLADVTCDYNFYGRIQTLICENGGIIEDVDFSENVRLTFRIPAESFEFLDAAIFDKSCGKIRCRVTGEKYLKI